MDPTNNPNDDCEPYTGTLVYRDYGSPYEGRKENIESSEHREAMNEQDFNQDLLASNSECEDYQCEGSGVDYRSSPSCTTSVHGAHSGFTSGYAHHHQVGTSAPLLDHDSLHVMVTDADHDFPSSNDVLMPRVTYSQTVSDSELSRPAYESREPQGYSSGACNNDRVEKVKKSHRSHYGSVDVNDRLTVSDTERVPQPRPRRLRKSVYPSVSVLDTSMSSLISEFSEIPSANRYANYRALRRANSHPAPAHRVSEIQRHHDEHEQRLRSLPARDTTSRTSDVSNTDSESSSTDDESVSFTASLNRRQVLVLISLALTDLGSYMCLSILAPFFPKEASDKGVSNTISGWIFGVFALVQFVTSPIFGKLIPRVGSRFLFIGGQFFGGGCTILFGFLSDIDTSNGSTLFIVYCLVLRSFLALGCTASATASFAITAQCFPDHIATVFGILETFTGLGCVIGPALGGVLYQYGGFVMPFAVLGFFMIITVPINLYVLPTQEEGSTNTGSSQLSHICRIVPIVVVLCSVVIGSLIWAILDPTLEPHLRIFNLDASEVGLIFLLMSACYAICSPLWGWVADKVEDSSPLLIVGYLVAAVGLMLLGPSPILGMKSTLYMNMIALCILGIAVSLAVIPTFDKILWTAEKAGIEESLSMYGAVAGLWGSAYALGEFIGPSAGGWLVDSFGFAWTMTYIAALCIVTAVVLIILYVWECRQPPVVVPVTGNTIPKELIDENDEDSPIFTHSRVKPGSRVIANHHERLRSWSEESYVYVSEGTPLLS